jgi:cytochrome c
MLGYVYSIAALTAIGIGSYWALGTEEPRLRSDIAQVGENRFATVSPSAHQELADCVVCHRLSGDGPDRSAPPLYGIVGSPVAGAHWFAYSPALARKGGKWTPEELDRYLADPVGYVRGTFKTLSPIRDAAKRKRIIKALQDNEAT